MINLHCFWKDETTLAESIIWGWAFKSSLSLDKWKSYCDFAIYLIIYIYGGHVGFRFAVVDGSISLSYLRSLLLKMWV